MAHPHGTRGAYNRGGCRCPRCTQANTAYFRHYRGQPHLPTGALLTACWCERNADYIPADNVIQGRTWSCHHPDCRPPGGDAA